MMTMIYITIFRAGNLYFSNKKNKVTINYCSRFCLRIDDQLRRRRETKTKEDRLRLFFCI